MTTTITTISTDAWLCTQCGGPLMFADVGDGQHEICPESLGVYRLRLEYQTAHGDWVPDTDPLNAWEGKQCRIVSEQAYRFTDASIQWAPMSELGAFQGKFLIGPTTDTPAALEALGLSRTTIWRSLARRWYTLGYHESQPREGMESYTLELAPGITHQEAQADLLARHSGLTKSAARRASKRGRLIVHTAPPETAPPPPDTLPTEAGGFAVLKNPHAFAMKHVLSQLDLWECREEWQEQIPDFVQTALLKCWEKRLQEGVQNFTGYFAAIVHQVVRDAVRKERHRRALCATQKGEA